MRLVSDHARVCLAPGESSACGMGDGEAHLLPYERGGAGFACEASNGCNAESALTLYEQIGSMKPMIRSLGLFLACLSLNNCNPSDSDGGASIGTSSGRDRGDGGEVKEAPELGRRELERLAASVVGLVALGAAGLVSLAALVRWLP